MHRNKFIRKYSDRIIIGRTDKFKLEIYSGWGFHIKYLTKGYGNYGYSQFIFQLIFGNFFLTLPWKHNIKVEGGHDAPSYGITYHSSSFMIYHGKKIKVVYMPFDYAWIRTSLLLKDGTWEEESKGNRKNFYEPKWLDKQWQIKIPYQHTTSNKEIIDLQVTCHITEREWRQKWLKWIKWGARIKRTVNVEFSEEVGPGRGSWKGGVLGTGFDITKTGKIEDGLNEMEKRYDMHSIEWERYKKIKQIIKK